MAILYDSFSYRAKLTPYGQLIDRWYGDNYPEFILPERLYHLHKVIYALLTHDEVYIRLDSLEELMDVLGIEAVSALIREGILKIMYSWMVPWYMVTGDDTTMLLNMQKSNPEQDVIRRIQEKYSHGQRSHYPRILNNDLLHNWQYDYWDQLAGYEANNDMHHPVIKAQYNISSNERDSYVTVRDDDMIAHLRFFLMERAIKWSEELNTDEITFDNDAPKVLLIKNNLVPEQRLEEVMAKIIQARDLPNLALLYNNRCIDIHQIIEMRDNTDGIKFREWMKNKEYRPDELERIMMSKISPSIFEKGIRWAVVSGLGFIPIAGGILGAVAGVGNELMGRFSKWSPDLFFDRVLKKDFQKHKRY